jgi:hypothetical protein
MFSSPMPWDFWLIFVLLGLVIPWRGYARMRHLMALPEVTSRERIKMYLATIFFQWVLTVLVAWRALARPGNRSGREPFAPSRNVPRRRIDRDRALGQCAADGALQPSESATAASSGIAALSSI